MARSAEKIQKYLGALREAKEYLENIQNRSAHQTTIDKSNEILGCVEKLNTNQSKTQQIVSRSDKKLEDLVRATNETQQVIDELSKRLLHQDDLASSLEENSVEGVVDAVEEIMQSRSATNIVQLNDLHASTVADKSNLHSSGKRKSADCIENLDEICAFDETPQRSKHRTVNLLFLWNLQR